MATNLCQGKGAEGSFQHQCSKDMEELIRGEHPLLSVLPFGSTHLIFFKAMEKINTNRRIHVLNQFTNAPIYSNWLFIHIHFPIDVMVYVVIRL